MIQPRKAEVIFEELKVTPKQLEIDGVTYYVVEGDLLLDEAELFAYAIRRAALELAMSSGLQGQREGLVGITDDAGRIVRWRKGQVLTYSVALNTFSEQEYETVVKAMRRATAEWEAICGVNFKHLKELDDNGQAGGETPLFRVASKNANGRYIAVAFFPYHEASRRMIFIDPSYFSPNLGFDRVGVLRHELGHVLGFRHEHIRSGAPPQCPDESLVNIIELTDYDPKSVMHYFCGQLGDKSLSITELDRQGARLLYGPPDKEVTYFE